MTDTVSESSIGCGDGARVTKELVSADSHRGVKSESQLRSHRVKDSPRESCGVGRPKGSRSLPRVNLEPGVVGESHGSRHRVMAEPT